MKSIQWDKEKNLRLIQERGVSFDFVAQCIVDGNFLDDISHPNRVNYAHQRVFVVKINDYVYGVPYVEDDEKIFLKTIIPDRRLTKKYLTNK